MEMIDNKSEKQELFWIKRTKSVRTIGEFVVLTTAFLNLAYPNYPRSLAKSFDCLNQNVTQK